MAETPQKPRQIAKRNRAFNIEILKCLDGKGSLIESLSVLTGLTCDSLKARAKRMRYVATSEELDGPPNRLDGDEMRYLSRVYSRSSDPEVQEFMAKICTCTRKRPDWRSADDAKGRPTKKRSRIPA
jgi:hypothetical protein